MAKLSANGRKEIVRLVRDLPGNIDGMSNRKQYLVLMSDNVVLTKTTYDITDVYAGKVVTRHESGHYTKFTSGKWSGTPEKFTAYGQARGFEIAR